MLAREPENRPPTAEAVAESLAPFCTAAPVPLPASATDTGEYDPDTGWAPTFATPQSTDPRSTERVAAQPAPLPPDGRDRCYIRVTGLVVLALAAIVAASSWRSAGSATGTLDRPPRAGEPAADTTGDLPTRKTRRGGVNPSGTRSCSGTTTATVCSAVFPATAAGSWSRSGVTRGRPERVRHTSSSSSLAARFVPPALARPPQPRGVSRSRRTGRRPPWAAARGVRMPQARSPSGISARSPGSRLSPRIPPGFTEWRSTRAGTSSSPRGGTVPSAYGGCQSERIRRSPSNWSQLVDPRRPRWQSPPTVRDSRWATNTGASGCGT